MTFSGDDGHGIGNDAHFRQQILTASWQRGDKRLPRSIKGPDLDHWIHTSNDGGAFLFCEFKKGISTWEELAKQNRAQASAYAALVMRGRSLCILCKHDVPPQRDIDVRSDVLSFNIMCQDGVRAIASKKVLDGAKWFEFVDSFIRNPSRVCYETARSIAAEDRRVANA